MAGFVWGNSRKTRRRGTAASALLLISGCLVQLSAAINFPPNGLARFSDCNLPQDKLQESFTISTDAGTLVLNGVEEQGSFLADGVLSVIVSPHPPAGGNVTVTANTGALRYGTNKAYIGFFTNGATTYAGFVTVEIDCFPTATITLTQPDTVSLQTTQGAGPGSFTLKSEIHGTADLNYANETNPIRFTMTPDTTASPSPWIVSASVPGLPANMGQVTPGGVADLTVNFNPTGLAAQSDPYVGFVKIRDNVNNYGSAALTVQLTVSASVTGNATVPHIAVNGVYVTDFYVLNTASQPANFSMAFYDDNGSPLKIPVAQADTTGRLQNRVTTNTVSFQVPANGSAFYEAGDPALAQLGGSARITADSSIGVQAAFRLRQQPAGGTYYYEAAVPATTGSKEFVMPFDTTTFPPTGEQIYTGVAIANIDTGNLASVSCAATDLNGAAVGAITFQIPANGHAVSLSFPSGKRGILDCISNTLIGAIGLHAYLSGAISSLPVFLK